MWRPVCAFSLNGPVYDGLKADAVRQLGFMLKKSADGSVFELKASVLSPDGVVNLEAQFKAPAKDPESIVRMGTHAADTLLKDGAGALLKQIRS